MPGLGANAGSSLCSTPWRDQRPASISAEPTARARGMRSEEWVPRDGQRDGGQRPAHLCTLIPAKCRSSQAWPSRDGARPAGSSTQACGPWIPPGGRGLRWETGGWRDGLRLLRWASHPRGGRQGKSPHGHRRCSPSSQLPSLAPPAPAPPPKTLPRPPSFGLSVLRASWGCSKLLQTR